LATASTKLHVSSAAIIFLEHSVVATK